MYLVNAVRNPIIATFTFQVNSQILRESVEDRRKKEIQEAFEKRAERQRQNQIFIEENALTDEENQIHNEDNLESVGVSDWSVQDRESYRLKTFCFINEDTQSLDRNSVERIKDFSSAGNKAFKLK